VRKKNLFQVPKLRTDSTFVCAETLQGVQKLRNISIFQRWIKIRRKSAFAHRETAIKSIGSQGKHFKVSKVPKAHEGKFP